MKRDNTCEQVLLTYFSENKTEWIKKVLLYVQAEDWSPETVGRTLRTLEEEGKISVSYYDGKYAKGLAQYKLGKVELPKKPHYEVIDGRAVLMP